jgi:hypothetical protein
MFYLGKGLQLSGLVTASWAFVAGVFGNDVAAELTLLGIAVVAFVMGSLILRRFRSD